MILWSQSPLYHSVCEVRLHSIIAPAEWDSGDSKIPRSFSTFKLHWTPWFYCYRRVFLKLEYFHKLESIFKITLAYESRKKTKVRNLVTLSIKGTVSLHIRNLLLYSPFKPFLGPDKHTTLVMNIYKNICINIYIYTYNIYLYTYILYFVLFRSERRQMVVWEIGMRCSLNNKVCRYS